MGVVIRGRPLVAGEGRGRVLRTEEALSFWGGYDAATGEIIDRRHPLSGANARGAVLVLPASRGSSTTSAVLLEAIRRDTAPAAIVLSTADAVVALAGVVADELYGRSIPIVVVDPTDAALLDTGAVAEVARDGGVTIDREGETHG